jgi:hypothetical protein
MQLESAEQTKYQSLSLMAKSQDRSCVFHQDRPSQWNVKLADCNVTTRPYRFGSR